jgi:hypothetical protein
MKILSNDKNKSFSFVSLRTLRNYENLKTLKFVERERERERQIYKDYLQTPCCSVISLLAFRVTRLVSSTYEKSFFPQREKKILYYKNQSVNVM